MPRELIEPNKGDKSYVRRKKGKFTKSQDDVGRSLTADYRKKAKKTAEKGDPHRGDQRARKKKRKTTRNNPKRGLKIVWTHFSATHTGA
jgi:hypothetical protein